MSPLLSQLIKSLTALPGVGPKSAQRLAFFLLSSKEQGAGLRLVETLSQAIEKIQYCQRCRNYSETGLCLLCANPKRMHSLLCIVETPADVLAIEQTLAYRGSYFVLHGRLSPLDGMGPKEIALPQLFSLLQIEPIEEVILATNPTAEGRATATYIANTLRNNTAIKCTRIAHGVPLGGELEYLDSGTLSHAFSSRSPLI